MNRLMKDAATTNETPMYVRPYLEDPIFLQPDDGEVELLHPKIAAEEHHKTHIEKEKELITQHDLPGDPDLENPSEHSPDARHEEPAWIEEHRNTLARTAAMTANKAVNPNGFRKANEKCNHNFECISGKCMSWLGKTPVCMPF